MPTAGEIIIMNYYARPRDLNTYITSIILYVLLLHTRRSEAQH